jgi:hypothetical protein
MTPRFPARRHQLPGRRIKGKTPPRVVELPDGAPAIARRLANLRTDAPHLCNADGVPWKRDAIDGAFIRLEKKIGRKLSLGAFRKGYANEAPSLSPRGGTRRTRRGRRDGCAPALKSVQRAEKPNPTQFTWRLYLSWEWPPCSWRSPTRTSRRIESLDR